LSFILKLPYPGKLPTREIAATFITAMDDRICSECGGSVSKADRHCRHCGTGFEVVIKRGGSFANTFCRLLLGLCALSLPVLCTVVALTTPKGWGNVVAYWTNQACFVPWITTLIALGVLVWLTEPRK
jgi:ribosomal protein L40E